MNTATNSPTPTQYRTRSSDPGPQSSILSLISSFFKSGHRSSVIGHRIIGPLLLTLVLLLTLGPAWAADTPIKDRLVSIDQKSQTFTQALDAVAEQADIS